MAELKHLDELGAIYIAAEAYIVHDDKVLLHKRSETKKKFPGFWIGPGGHVNEGEDALTAAMREVREETGVTISKDDINLKAIAIHHHLDRQEVWVSFIYLASIPEHQAVDHVHNQEGESAWIPLNELSALDKLFPPSAFYFEHVLDNQPGILYTFIRWENSQLVEVVSQNRDNR
jgi:8-oxo-dGTP pyrophosphatase MutT (NUDIX family)